MTVTGFLLVTGILNLALVVTAKQLDGLGDRSQRGINQSATAMRASRILIEQITAMERNIRQYRILNDAEILQVYANRRITFAEMAREVEKLNLADEITGYVDSLLANEEHAYASITTYPVNAEIEALYPQMLNVAYTISRFADLWTNNELASIRQENAEAQTRLTIQTLALVSAALVLAGIFTALITRPLMQVTRAINQLDLKRTLSLGNIDKRYKLFGDNIDMTRTQRHCKRGRPALVSILGEEGYVSEYK